MEEETPVDAAAAYLQEFWQSVVSWVQTAWQGDSWPEFALLLVIAAFVFSIIFIAFFQTIWWFRTRLSPFKTHPPGWPSSRTHLLQVEENKPFEFTWSYPKIHCEGGTYDVSEAVRDEKDTDAWFTQSGARIKFIKK